jgi:DNA processing protein
VIDACDGCLRRSHLIAFLAADIEQLAPPGAASRVRALDAGTATLLAALGPRRRAAVRGFLREFDPDAARAACRAAALEAVCLHAGSFPAPLADLWAPPPVLYASALAPLRDDEPRAAVIGSRRPSEHGRTMAYRLGRQLGAAGVPVVSGMALGIDALAHRGCLAADGRTIAVLASGADVPYPRTHRALYERIRRDGAVVSEMPPGSPPYRWLFPARNRIMAALARVTVVVEAARRSGTLITAEYAAELGRDVAAVPGWASAEAAAGTNGLLREGAAVVTDVQDVLDLLYGVGARTAPDPPHAALEPHEACLLELIAGGAAVSEAAAAAGLAPAAARAALARLELRGLVRRTPAGRYLPA